MDMGQRRHGHKFIAILVLVVLPAAVEAILSRKLFPYGTETEDQRLEQEDDTSSLEFQLSTPIKFFDQTHQSVFINSNGLISFYTDIPNFFNVQLPMHYPIIAPFYADVDVRGTGAIFYRETDDPKLLERANNLIEQHFSTGASFKARALLIVTWDAVGAHNTKTDKTNTFQLVVASDSRNSFAIFLYLNIEWIYSEAKHTNQPEMRAQAGLMLDDDRNFLLPGSGSDQLRNIHKISNVGEKGLWLFQIGYFEPPENIKLPDLNIGQNAISSQLPQDCTVGASFCHFHANCIDYNPGFCCECDAGFVGNGKNCLREGEPQRINGKVSGILNDVKLQDVDLHSYVVTADGRAYTALSRIEEPLGSDMQTLLSTGVVIGWLFATRSSKMPLNGYEITGGVFNSNMTIEFPQTGQYVRIEQKFLGLDVFNYLRVNVQLQGTTPSIPVGKSIEVEDYSEEYTLTAPGVIRSHSTHTYQLESTDIKIPFVVDQTIHYDDCAFGPIDRSVQVFRLQLQRNYVVYDSREKVIRYAVLAAVESLESENPCENGKELCGAHSSCIVEGSNYKCVCDSGFENLYETINGERSTCIDVNECAQGKDTCHAHADCVNREGSFTCRCREGYEGDGINCNKLVSCSELQCHEDAECVQLPGQSAQCRCKPNFLGDGRTCQPSEFPHEDCRKDPERCDLYADCVFSHALQMFQCKCHEGFTGNGLICTEELENCETSADICHAEATCVFDEEVHQHYCKCKENFRGDGYTNCDSLDVPHPTPKEEEGNGRDGESDGRKCNEVNYCDVNAHCVYDTRQGTYSCRCTAGYEGDGINCYPSNVICNGIFICSVNAKCILDEVDNRESCVCNEGYYGDGIICIPRAECASHDDCDVNAQCVFDDIFRQHRCKCNRGYAGSGKECSLEPDVSCDIMNKCHPDADCNYDSHSHSYLCLCKSGFTGDGYTCEPSITPCNIINNCDPNAECTYDNNERSFRCQCLQGYSGDGLTCFTSSRSCLNDPNQCDANADCLPHPSLHQYVCQCRPNFVGDGFTCNASPSHEGEFLLVNQGMATVRVPLNPSTDDVARPIILFPYQTAVGIDIDCLRGQFYWTDISGSVILRAEYNGSEPIAIINTNIVSPESVAVDWVSRNIFWTDSGKDTVEVANLDSKERKVLFDTDLTNPRGIIAHPGRGKIYWTDWDRKGPKIEVADMDGTNREVFVSENLGLPNLLTIDYDREDLCWADAGTQKIECIGLRGKDRRTVVAPVSYPFGLANSRETLFWTDWQTNAIHSASKVAYSPNEPVKSPLGSTIKTFGIVYVPKICPRVSNPCGLNNGGCKSLCLPNSRGGRTCACPDQGDKKEVAACNEIL